MERNDSLISEIEIKIVKPQAGLVAFASFVYDRKFYFSSIGIFSKLQGGGYRLVYPTKLVGNAQINIYHPIQRDISILIEKAIVAEYEDLMKGIKSNGTIWPA